MYIFHRVRKRDFDPSTAFYGEEHVKTCGFLHCSILTLIGTNKNL